MTNINKQTAETIKNNENNTYITINTENTNKEKSLILKVKQSFIDSIEALEFWWHTLNSIFVWPEFYFISWNEEKNIDWSLDVFLEEKNKTCFIKWIDLSWKSSVGKKIFLDSISDDYYPILLNWSIIDKWNLNFDKILEKEFNEQYTWDYEDYKNKDNKIIIVDNYHIWVNKKFIKFCKENFLKIFFIISDDDFVMYFKDEENYVEFDTYTITTFNNSRKHDLIFNWLKKDYQTKDEVYNKNFDLIENRIEDITSKNQMFPKHPFFLLSIIQAFENINTKNINLTSYWHCYYALIISQLDKKWIDNNSLDYCFNYLKNLAFHIFTFNWNNSDNISIEEYDNFKNNYSTRYNLMSKSVLNRLENDQYSIIRKKDWKVKFEFEYIYYYFIWKYIADNEDNGDIIENLCEWIYKKSSSNILIFTIHHSSSNKLLERIQKHSITTFFDYKITLLSNEDTCFLNNLIKELPHSILNNKSISDNRKLEQKVKDENEKNYKELTDSEIEENKEIIELTKAFKIIEVLGQILKNRAWSLEKNKLEELLFNIENLWLRVMTYLLETIKSDDFRKSIEKMVEIFEHSKGEKQFISEYEKTKKIEEFVQNMWLRTILWLLFKIFQSVAIEQIVEHQRVITFNNQSPSYELLYSLFSLNYGNVNIPELKKLYQKFEEEKNFLALKSMSFFIQIYMNGHYIKVPERQKLHALLWIKKYIPNKVSN